MSTVSRAVFAASFAAAGGAMLLLAARARRRRAPRPTRLRVATAKSGVFLVLASPADGDAANDDTAARWAAQAAATRERAARGEVRRARGVSERRAVSRGPG